MTYTHTACLDGGTYTYTLNWGDNSGGDITEAGVTLADGEAKEYTHVYETKGIYSASFKVEVSFPNDSMLSNEEMRMWEINNETCSLYRTEAPTISPAPSMTPTTVPTSAASNANAHSLLLTAISAIYIFKKLFAN